MLGLQQRRFRPPGFRNIDDYSTEAKRVITAWLGGTHGCFAIAICVSWFSSEFRPYAWRYSQIHKDASMAKSLLIFLLASGWFPAASAQVVDPGIRTAGVPRTDEVIPGANAKEKELFDIGINGFGQGGELVLGTGPRFNDLNCTNCHVFPAFGGSSGLTNGQESLFRRLQSGGARNVLPPFVVRNGPILEARFKRKADGSPDGSVHPLFVVSGLVDPLGIGDASNCNIAQPDFQTEVARGNVSLRTVTPTFGLGLVEQIAQTTILSNLAADASRKAALGISGRVNRGPNDDRIGRFGWKSQNVSLQVFSAEALAVEQGQTNMFFPNESDETPECQFSPSPNLVPALSGPPHNAVGEDVVTLATNFMKFSAPALPHATVPGGADSIARGRATFATVGCATCHTPTMRTRSGTDFPVLANKDVNLYSDLALHNMGPGLADDIAQGLAKGDEFRTAPLWGVGTRVFFLHDGRTNNLIEAIRAHRSAGNGTYGPSEANAVIASYDALSPAQQQDLVNFLRSL